MKPGLRLDQGPPLAVPLIFFLTAPLFLVAAGLYASLNGPEWTVSRWSTATLALTHLIALGYLALAMFGALTQMAPVVAGAPLPRVVGTSRYGYAFFVAGVPLLSWGLASGQATALWGGALACTLGILIILASAGIGLLRASPSMTRQSMLLALLSLLGTLPFGLLLVAWLAGAWSPAEVGALADSHAALGLIGWVGLLVIGAAYRVVPMLQVTPDYPGWLTRTLGTALALSLVVWLCARLMDWPVAGDIASLGVSAVLAWFALTTLNILARRRRKQGDATLHYWRLSMVSLLACALLGGLLAVLPGDRSESMQLLVGMLFLLGFAVSVINGMLLKVVPFLAWFHLQAQVGMRRTGLANMKDFFSDRVARRYFHLHLAALALLLPSPWLAWLAIPGGLFLAASALVLEFQLLRAYRLFRTQGGNALQR